MEFFRNPNIQFLKYKWYFLAMSLVLSVAGILSMVFWHGVPLGVEFRGGTVVEVKFTHTPDNAKIRADMDRAGAHNARIQAYGSASDNEVMVALDLRETSEQAIEAGRNKIVSALEPPDAPAGKKDLNNSSVQDISEFLLTQDPLHLGTDAAPRYNAIAQQIGDFRYKTKGGVLSSLDELREAGVPDAVINSLKTGYYTSDFGVRDVQIVGPQVGKQLQTQAKWAVVYSLLGMLVYLWFRFELIYGVAAVVACFHDTLITIGMFSLLNTEISLTVIAAILTLVGYSMNDTIVVFDRIRENVKLLRRESLADIVDRSINQTLSRTVLTSGLTFLTVLSLYIFGGEVLHGFSLALVIGILIGTYSSIFIASPMLVAYQDWRLRRAGHAAPVAVASTGRREKVRAKG
ncbi:MAG: protein translocase subunit SecF [Terriglobales bacterium]